MPHLNKVDVLQCKELWMIPARKTSARFNMWFAKQVEKRLQQTFGRMYVRQLDLFAEESARRPLIVVSNHTARWDPMLLIYMMNRPLELDAYAMMDARNMKRLPFLARVGGFGVHLDRPGDGAEAIAYGASLLDRPQRVVCVYPQGAERPLNQRPLGFRSGSAALALEAPDDVWVVPMAVRYVFGPRERPDVYMSLGVPAPPVQDLEAERQRQEAAVTAELATIEASLYAKDPTTEGFEVLFRHTPGVISRSAEHILSRAVRMRLWMRGESLRDVPRRRDRPDNQT